MRKRLVLISIILIMYITGCGNTSNNSLQLGSSQVESNEKMSQDFDNEICDTENETSTGCVVENQTGVEEIEKIPDEGLSLMQMVLLNRAEFFGKLSSAEDEPIARHKVEEYESFCEYTKESHDKFYIVDLDQDGKEEIAVMYGGRVLIFREMNNQIYGYNWSARLFAPAYKDGTFAGSGSASRNYFYGEVEFKEDSFLFKVITAIEYEHSKELDEGVPHYYKNGMPGESESLEITEEEYDQIMSQYSQEKVTQYDFTIENILKYVE